MVVEIVRVNVGPLARVDPGHVALGLQRRPHGEHRHLFLTRGDLAVAHFEVVRRHDLEGGGRRVMQSAISRGAGSESTDREVSDHLFELRAGDEAGPQQARLIVETGDDGRLQAYRRIPAVQDDADRIAQLIAHMLRLGRTQSPVAIRGWCRDAATEGVQQLLCNGMRGDADSDAVLPACDDVVDVFRLGQYQGQGARPEFRGQLFRDRWQRGHPAAQIPRIVQMHDHRMIGRTPLDLENLAHGGRIGGIRPESIHGLGREHHQIAGAQGFDGFFDFGLSSSYHLPMISRLRYQQSLATLPSGRFVPQCRFYSSGSSTLLYFTEESTVGGRIHCMNTKSSQRPNLNPTSRKWPTLVNPRLRCKPIETALSASIPAIMTCLELAAARAKSSTSSALPIPCPRRSARTWTLCSTLCR